MKKLLIVLTSLAVGGIAWAGPSTFVEGALIDGGENARNGSSNSWGAEVAGSAAIGEHWYAGGVLGNFSRDDSGNDVDNTYLNLNGGWSTSIAERTDLNLEAGIWVGQQDTDADDTDPHALELKAGVTQSFSEKLSAFATLSWVVGDLDTDTDSDLRNYVWSLGISYSFSDLFSLGLKMVNGVNGVNGQDQVLRLGARWTF